MVTIQRPVRSMPMVTINPASCEVHAYGYNPASSEAQAKETSGISCGQRMHKILTLSSIMCQ